MAVRARTAVDVEETLARFPLLAGARYRWRPLEGGLSHHVYLVDVDTPGPANPPPRCVLRILEPAVSAAGLGIDPVHELANTRLAAADGLGAAVLDALGVPPALLLEYIDGQTLSAADIPGRLDAVAAACRRLHAGTPFAGDFDILDKRAELLDLCTRYDLPVPAGYTDRNGDVAAIGAALAATPLPKVPCHNDLLAENFIEQPDGSLRIVDYQLSGNNDPAFELGDVAAEAQLDPERTAALTAAYFGADTSPALVARTRLYLALSNVTWTLWFAVHHGLLGPSAEPAGSGSTAVGTAPGKETVSGKEIGTDKGTGAANPDPGTTAASGSGAFDYWAEAAAKWARACRDLDAPDFGALLDAAAGRRAPTPRGPERAAGVPPEHHTEPEDSP